MLLTELANVVYKACCVLPSVPLVGGSLVGSWFVGFCNLSVISFFLSLKTILNMYRFLRIASAQQLLR